MATANDAASPGRGGKAEARDGARENAPHGRGGTPGGWGRKTIGEGARA